MPGYPYPHFGSAPGSGTGQARFLIVAVLIGAGLMAHHSSAAYDTVDPESVDFTFARVRFNDYGGGRRGYRGNPGWAHDYPRAERNFLLILSEVTGIRTARDSFVIVDLDSPEIMNYPMLYFSEPGTWDITEAEAANLREYLDRGGFAMFDDFDGQRDWRNFAAAMRQVYSDRQPELLTIEHPIFHCFYDIESLHLMPGYGQSFGFRGGPLFYGLSDEKGRLQAIINFNNDLGDYWEWSDEAVFSIDLSNEAYKFGVNYVVYALSH